MRLNQILIILVVGLWIFSASAQSVRPTRRPQQATRNYELVEDKIEQWKFRLAAVKLQSAANRKAKLIEAQQFFNRFKMLSMSDEPNENALFLENRSRYDLHEVLEMGVTNFDQGCGNFRSTFEDNYRRESPNTMASRAKQLVEIALCVNN